MAIIKQHIPNFCEGFKPKTVEFNTKEELLSIDFVNGFTMFGDVKAKDFYQFSYSDSINDINEYTLMAEYNSGRKWWVVGFIAGWDEITNQLPLIKYQSNQ